MIKLILSDIDGTILTNQHQVTSELKRTLQQIKVPFVLSSARSPEGMFEISNELALDTPLAAYNGALIVTKKGERIHSQPLVIDELQLIFSLIEATAPEIAINVYKDNQWLVSRMDTWVALERDITNTEPTLVSESDWRLLQTQCIHKLLLIGKTDQIERLMHQIDTLELSHTGCYRSKKNYLEITHRTVSKALALQKLVAYYGITLEETLAIGDHFNDLSMIQQAGIGVAMGNAPDEVKQAADEVALTNEENGVARMLQALLLRSF